jgi:hypothetical protein
VGRQPSSQPAAVDRSRIHSHTPRQNLPLNLSQSARPNPSSSPAIAVSLRAASHLHSCISPFHFALLPQSSAHSIHQIDQSPIRSPSFQDVNGVFRFSNEWYHQGKFTYRRGHPHAEARARRQYSQQKAAAETQKQQPELQRPQESRAAVIAHG